MKCVRLGEAQQGEKRGPDGGVRVFLWFTILPRKICEAFRTENRSVV